MRQDVTLQCTECSRENYRTSTDVRGGERLELKKHCPWCRKHTLHRQRRK